MEKLIKIGLASNNEINYSHFYEAIKSASRNLDYRHNIQIEIFKVNKYSIILKLNIPDNKQNFNIGRHLRGISDYLSKNYDEYKKLFIGNRLLTYTEITEELSNNEYNYDNLELIEILAKLLRKTDKKSLEKIELIYNILKNNK